MKRLLLLLALTLTVTAQAQEKRAQKQQGQRPPLVYNVENTMAKAAKPKMLPANELPVIHELPDALQGVTTFKDWAARRHAVGALIQHYGIGEKPAVGPDDVLARMDGDTLVVYVTVNGHTLVLRSEIKYPETGQPPYALMIGTSGISLPRQLFQGRPIATMVFHEDQVNDYSQWRPHHERGQHPFDRLYPQLKDNGAYSEWAWGLSRLVDGLQKLGPEVTRIDTERIGVTGCSYAGKMALYCGAFDERNALTIAQEMRENFHGDSVYQLPYDHHQLCAMVCPRALLLLGNPDYKWLADEAMLPSAQAAEKVWQKFGIEERMNYSIVGGHPHCMLPESQMPLVQAFIDKFLLHRDAKTR